MSLSTDYGLLTDVAFRGRIAMALLRASADIKNQTVDLPANHASRLALANSLIGIGEAEGMAIRFAPVIVAGDPDLRFAYENSQPALDQAAIGDQSILDGVNGHLDQFADAMYPQ